MRLKTATCYYWPDTENVGMFLFGKNNKTAAYFCDCAAHQRLFDRCAGLSLVAIWMMTATA
jgi:hypothetical protein